MARAYALADAALPAASAFFSAESCTTCRAAWRFACAAAIVAWALHFFSKRSIVFLAAFPAALATAPLVFDRISFMNAVLAALLAELSWKVRCTISLHLTAAFFE